MTDTVTTYDPSRGIVYRRAYIGRFRAELTARYDRSRVLATLTTVPRTGERAGRDPLTGALVTWIDPATVIPVRSEPSVTDAYPWGMPDVPRA